MTKLAADNNLLLRIYDPPPLGFEDAWSKVKQAGIQGFSF